MPHSPAIKAICFDFMGTCLDWHSSIVAALPQERPEQDRSAFALEWRQCYFDANAQRQADGHPPEDIDITHLRVLNEMLQLPKHEAMKTALTPKTCQSAVAAWHYQKAWPDVAPAIAALKERGYEVFVHANGTTRLQLDLCRSSGLDFNMLFSSELLGVYKPAPEAYLRGLELLKRKSGECVMVAAHAYDTRGAAAVGMKTVYIYRWTDDVLEDQMVVKGENDVYLDGMDGLVEAVDRLEGGSGMKNA
ncbi:hypothetical protein LTR10_008644 [Elasticomyces elasticus]|nr:hypothetical protein LTR10_008644 [Elasticomyces elasticus]KAK4974381.1 hypothetical protein LTR42_005025 [Elasticomyces elasticus]